MLKSEETKDLDEDVEEDPTSLEGLFRLREAESERSCVFPCPFTG